MSNNHENVILFPTWRRNLEEESLLALKQKKYSEALAKLDKLLDYQVYNHEIVIGKLICLMELGRYDEALSLCEDLLKEKNENYYHYVHIFLTILFQTNQYSALMDHVDYELSDSTIPSMIKEQFTQLYNMSKQMNDDLINEKSVEHYIELSEAINNEDHIRQWQLVENLRKMKIRPTDTIISYLVEDKIHPVIKTVIFKWLQDMNVSQDIAIHKFDIKLTVKPVEIAKIRSHTIIKQIMLSISDLEQKNPSLYILLEQLLYRYVYVRFPMVPESKDVITIAEALKNIGEQYLHIESTRETNDIIANYMNEIKICETLYLSIIDE